MSNTPSFTSKKEFVYESLFQQILSGELVPGSRLVIDDLASRLGVSAIPIREALHRLEADGFVTIEPYIGARVTEIHKGVIEEVFQLLETIETISAVRACQTMSTDDFDEIDRMVSEMDHRLDDVERWSQGNIELHLFICECASMHLSRRLFINLARHWDRVRRFYLQGVLANRISTAQQGHRDLLAALRNRDAVQVAQVIQMHNRAALSDYLRYVQEKEGQDISRTLPIG